MKKASKIKLILVLVILMVNICGCSTNSTTNDNGKEFNEDMKETTLLKLDSWQSDVKENINMFIENYGKTSSNYDKSNYVVFDFDNTTCIFDIQNETMIYQIDNMCFALDPSRFREALEADLNGDFSDLIFDVENSYEKLYQSYGPFTIKGVDEDTKNLMQTDPIWKEFATKMLLAYSEVNKKYDNWNIRILAGFSEEQMYELTYQVLSKYKDAPTTITSWSNDETAKDSKYGKASVEVVYGVSVSDNIKELYKCLNDNGFDIWICSASEINMVRAAVDVFGLHEYCTGIVAKTLQIKDEILQPEYDYESGVGVLCADNMKWEKDEYATHANCKEKGKVDAIINAISPHYNSAYPLACFMDSSGDYNFCTEFENTKMVVCFNRADRKVTDGGGIISIVAMYEKDVLGYDLKSANDNGDTLYLLQGRDENNFRTFINSNESIKYGEKDKTLFANEDNFKLLNYIKQNNMSIKEIIDTFAIKSNGEELGFNYGFLDKYDGYHNIK